MTNLIERLTRLPWSTYCPVRGSSRTPSPYYCILVYWVLSTEYWVLVLGVRLSPSGWAGPVYVGRWAVTGSVLPSPPAWWDVHTTTLNTYDTSLTHCEYVQLTVNRLRKTEIGRRSPDLGHDSYMTRSFGIHFNILWRDNLNIICYTQEILTRVLEQE